MLKVGDKVRFTMPIMGEDFFTAEEELPDISAGAEGIIKEVSYEDPEDPKGTDNEYIVEVNGQLYDFIYASEIEPA